MEHYITEIDIDEVRHLSNIVVSLNADQRQHLILTGKNGSGKTSLLLAIKQFLKLMNKGLLNQLAAEWTELSGLEKQLEKAETEGEKERLRGKYNDKKRNMSVTGGIRIRFSDSQDIESRFRQGDLITAYFPADRKIKIIRANGVEDVRLDTCYEVDVDPAVRLHKYMVHLKTQQSYARNENDMLTVERIQKWFERFEYALRVLLDDDTITLEYYYKEYDFKIHQAGRAPYGLDVLSDGYSSAIHIVSSLILRMDRNWLLGDKLSEYDIEGIVLIDELETHLHIELQKKILPFLVEFFPRIQFIVTTHSPYILNSISNAKAYDLERGIELEDLSVYSSGGLAEGYFGADEYSDSLKEKIERYKYLKEKADLTEDEHAERAKLRSELKNIPKGMSQEARDKFDDIEGKHL